jgi:phosphonatase-like hydrolase
MPKIQLVVFDMAGTTVKDENEVQDCFFEAIANTGLKVETEQINVMMGWAKKRVFQTLWKEHLGEDHPDYSEKVEASFAKFKQVLEHHYHTASVKPTEGCLEVFDWLKSKQIKIALNTGFYREVTNIILHRLGWSKDFNEQYIGGKDSIIQASVTPSEIFENEGRPAPFMIQKAMYRLQIFDPQTVIHIGDTPADLAAGIYANCLRSFGVTNGTHTEAELAQFPNHGLLSSLQELPEKIQDLCS